MRHGLDVLQIFSIIQAEFYIPRVRKLILHLKKSCPGCIKLNNISFSAVEGDMPDILKSIQPPFSYCQADLFGPILAHNNNTPSKGWVLVVLCLSSHAVSTPRNTAPLLRPEHLKWFPENLCSTRYSPRNLDRRRIKYGKIWERSHAVQS